jgi:hypothetical protein
MLDNKLKNKSDLSKSVYCKIQKLFYSDACGKMHRKDLAITAPLI